MAIIGGGNSGAEKIISGEIKFTDPPFLGALEDLVELMPYAPDDFASIDYITGNSMFIAESVAMFIEGSWMVHSFFIPEGYDFEMGWFPIPPKNEGDTTMMALQPDGGIAINTQESTQAKLDAILIWMNYLATPEFMQDYAELFLVFPALTGDFVLESDPLLNEMLKLINDPDTETYHGFEEDRLNGGEPGAAQLVDDALFRLFTGEFTAQQAAEFIQEGMELWYEPFME